MVCGPIALFKRGASAFDNLADDDGHIPMGLAVDCCLPNDVESMKTITFFSLAMP